MEIGRAVVEWEEERRLLNRGEAVAAAAAEWMRIAEMPIERDQH